MFRKTVLATGLAGALTLLAACGGSSGTDNSAANAGGSDSLQVQSAPSRPEANPEDDRAIGDARTNMCRFISAGDVSAILDEKMSEGGEPLNQVSGKTSISHCTWLVDGSDYHALASVFQRKSTQTDAASTFERGRNEYPEAKDVSGLGDRAYFVASTGQLNVLDGDAWFIISARKGSETTRAGTELTPHLLKLGELVVKKY